MTKFIPRRCKKGSEVEFTGGMLYDKRKNDWKEIEWSNH